MSTARPNRRTRLRVASVLVAITLVGVLAACEPSGPNVAFSSLERPDVPANTRYVDEVFSNVSVTSDIPYSTTEDLDGNPMSFSLDLYQPADDTETSRPAVVVAHGGGFTSGNKTMAPAVFLAEHFAKAGYVAVSIDYRTLSPVGCGHGRYDDGYTDICQQAGAAAATDAQAAVRWLRANATTYGIDPSKIAMTGTSAGAVMSVMVGSMSGLSDDPTNPASVAFMHGAPRNTSNPGHPSTISAWASVSGGLPPMITDYNGGFGQALVDHYSTLPAPGYFFHGTEDQSVPYAFAEATRDQLLDIGRVVGFMGFPGLGHVQSLLNAHGTLIANQMTWFFAYLMGVVEPSGTTTSGS